MEGSPNQGRVSTVHPTPSRGKDRKVKRETSGATAVDGYIEAQPEHVRERLTELRRTIARAAPEASEKISYGVPTFDLHGNLVHHAAFRNHIGFYPTPSGIEAFENELQRYRHAKGSVQFPLTEPLPLDLVARIVQFRVKENAAKQEKGWRKPR
jgi:uncharacterized protein YdhG (YjbR/CyaY superfamily)